MSQLSPEAKRLMHLAREWYSPTYRRATDVRSALSARLASKHDASVRWGGGPLDSRSLSAARSLGIGLVAAGFTVGTIMLGRSVAGPATQTPASAQSVVVRSHPEIAHPEIADPEIAHIAPVLEAAPIARASVLAADPRAPDSQAHEVAASRVTRPLPTVADRTPAAPDTTHGRSSARAPSASADHKHEDSAPTFASSPDAPTPGQVAPPAPLAPQHGPAEDRSLSRELAIIRSANAALTDHDGRTALALVDQHLALFPSGRLSQERLVLRALALCALGRNADARAAAQELARIAPRSPHWLRLRAEPCMTQYAARPVP